ncbi:TPA: hypothetical protein EYP27_00760 [Candidatus Bathyarchaeota archaeon]|nr:hypothetical protein [Candidatus Bathyarchaeota archaeon]
MKIKVNVKPLFSNYPKTVFWTLSGKEEAEERIKKTVKELRSKLSDEASILEPVLIERPEDTRKLKEDLDAVDIFLPFSVGGSSQILSAYLESFTKPIASSDMDTPAFVQ